MSRVLARCQQTAAESSGIQIERGWPLPQMMCCEIPHPFPNWPGLQHVRLRLPQDIPLLWRLQTPGNSVSSGWESVRNKEETRRALSCELWFLWVGASECCSIYCAFNPSPDALMCWPGLKAGRNLHYRNRKCCFRIKPLEYFILLHRLQ